MPQKIIAVTGANRGIGLEICRQLAALGERVILTARSEAKGRQARQELADAGLAVDFLQLDVTDDASIERFVDDVKTGYGRLDVLLNNAGILIDSYSNALGTTREVILKTLDTDAVGAFDLARRVIPIMRANGGGRIINVSSGMGALNGMGGGNIGYRMAKAALNAATLVLHAETRGENISVNSVCPGWVRTDMGGVGAHRTVAQGADTAVWLATMENPPSGKFLRDRKFVEW